MTSWLAVVFLSCGRRRMLLLLACVILLRICMLLVLLVLGWMQALLRIASLSQLRIAL